MYKCVHVRKHNHIWVKYFVHYHHRSFRGYSHKKQKYVKRMPYWAILFPKYLLRRSTQRFGCPFTFVPSSATTVLSSVTLHKYPGQFDWQTLVFIIMHEAGETNLLPMKSNVTIKYYLITMTSYLDFLLKTETNAYVYFYFEW